MLALSFQDFILHAIVVNRPEAGVIRFDADYPEPTAGPGEVLVRLRLAGICSTDLEIARGYMGFAGVPGHEFVGEVIGGSSRLAGKRIVAEINCPPAGFDSNELDARKHAAGRTVLGILERDGAFAERVIVPEANCLVVPDSVSDEGAVFVEPLAAAVQVLRDRPVRRGERVAVLGTGRLGILCAQVLALEACELVVIGRNPRTLTLCRELGLSAVAIDAVQREAAYDVVVECTGAAAGLRTALEIVRPRGAIVLKSTYASPPDLDLSPIVINEVRVIGSRCGPFDAAIELLEARRVRVEPLTTGRFPLSRGVEAFAAAVSGEHVKVLLEVGGS